MHIPTWDVKNEREHEAKNPGPRVHTQVADQTVECSREEANMKMPNDPSDPTPEERERATQ